MHYLCVGVVGGGGGHGMRVEVRGLQLVGLYSPGTMWILRVSAEKLHFPASLVDYGSHFCPCKRLNPIFCRNFGCRHRWVTKVPPTHTHHE